MHFLLLFLVTFGATFGALMINRHLASKMLLSMNFKSDQSARVANALLKSVIWCAVFAIAFALIGMTSPLLWWLLPLVVTFGLTYFWPDSLG